jgi:hypothetical protein
VGEAPGHLGGGRRLGAPARVAPGLGRRRFPARTFVARVDRPEPRLHSAGPFAARQHPVGHVEIRDRVRALFDLGERHRTAADPVREPAGVGHLVERIHIERADIFDPALGAEGVVDEIPAFAVFRLGGLARIERAIVVVLNGIVGIEAGLAGLHGQDQGGRNGDGGDLRKHR